MSISASTKIISSEEMKNILQQAVTEAGTQKACAAKLGVSVAYLNDCLSGRRRMGKSIANALGYRSVTVYEPLEGGEYIKTKGGT